MRRPRRSSDRRVKRRLGGSEQVEHFVKPNLGQHPRPGHRRRGLRPNPKLRHGLHRHHDRGRVDGAADQTLGEVAKSSQVVSLEPGRWRFPSRDETLSTHEPGKNANMRVR